MVELGIEVSSEHETCTVLFQQCDQCSEVLSQEQESSRGSGGGAGGGSKNWSHHFSQSTDSYERGPIEISITPLSLGEAFPLKKLLVLNVCHLCQWISRIVESRGSMIQETVWKRELGTLASHDSYVTDTPCPRPSNCPHLRLSASAKWEQITPALLALQDYYEGQMQ